MEYKIGKYGGVIRSDGACIPECLDNTDWQEYIAWLMAGNTPSPAYTQEELSAKALSDKAAKDASELQALIDMKLREIAIEALKKDGKINTSGKVIK